MTVQSQLDALSLVDSLRDRLASYTAGRFFLRDERLQGAADAVWRGPAENGGLLADLWVEGAFQPAGSGVSLSDLSQNGPLPAERVEHLARAGIFPDKRPLYRHQLDAWEATRRTTIEDEPAVLISAGTGAGKTEAFLLPILSRLFSTPAVDVGCGVSSSTRLTP